MKQKNTGSTSILNYRFHNMLNAANGKKGCF
nr:MAG TPA: hypothetical protein [Caudoviricetes sp.]